MKCPCTSLIRSAFTLIELLIVVAIIGILAAIAVPNFLNAQVRAKVSRVSADFRAIGTALHAYYIDHNTFIPDMGISNDEYKSFRFLTTPIAYLSSVEVTRDPFTAKSGRADQPFQETYYAYGDGTFIGGAPGDRQVYMDAGVGFILQSYGPARGRTFPWGTNNAVALGKRLPVSDSWLYDPTNGLISEGDILGTMRGIENRL